MDTHSPVMKAVAATAKRLAETSVTLRILGEAGTGKTWLVSHIHEWSGRKGKLVVVDAGQLASSLAESELFGHERGAFTGAVAAKKGLFEAARGGTIFIDEIGDLPLELQPKLLRVLESHVVRPVGSVKEVAVDVRVVVATCRDLDAMVAAGTFRADLHSRLGVAITMPPLRQRREDIPLILSGVSGLADDVRELLASHPYDWTGNVRELMTYADLGAAGLTADEMRAHLPAATSPSAWARVPTSQRRSVVLDMASRAGTVQTAQVAQALGMRLDCASRLLAKMTKDGELVQSKRGLFAPSLRQVCANNDSDDEEVV